MTVTGLKVLKGGKDVLAVRDREDGQPNPGGAVEGQCVECGRDIWCAPAYDPAKYQQACQACARLYAAALSEQTDAVALMLVDGILGDFEEYADGGVHWDFAGDTFSVDVLRHPDSSWVVRITSGPGRVTDLAFNERIRAVMYAGYMVHILTWHIMQQSKTLTGGSSVQEEYLSRRMMLDAFDPFASLANAINRLTARTVQQPTQERTGFYL